MVLRAVLVFAVGLLFLTACQVEKTITSSEDTPSSDAAQDIVGPSADGKETDTAQDVVGPPFDGNAADTATQDAGRGQWELVVDFGGPKTRQLWPASARPRGKLAQLSRCNMAFGQLTG